MKDLKQDLFDFVVRRRNIMKSLLKNPGKSVLYLRDEDWVIRQFAKKVNVLGARAYRQVLNEFADIVLETLYYYHGKIQNMFGIDFEREVLNIVTYKLDTSNHCVAYTYVLMQKRIIRKRKKL